MRYSDLHTYQHKAINFIQKQNCALFLQMGLGKTVSALSGVSEMIDCFVADRVLIIAPLRVANTVWKQEAEKWSHLKHLRVSICTGTEKQRKDALATPADIYVINVENTAWLINYKKPKWDFDTLIVDEGSAFKNPSSKRFKALKKVLPHTNRVVLLTGTPSPNGLLDLWSQCYLIDSGKTLGKTMSGYKQRFFDADFFGYTFTPKKGAENTIKKLLTPFCLSMSAVDYLELPDRVDLIERVELPPAVMKKYLTFERDLLATLDGGEDVEASSAAVLANKLLQYANGAIYIEDSKEWVEIHTAKLDALAEIIDQNQNENILVAYNYKHDLVRLQKRFKDAVVLDKSPEVISRWNRGEIKLLLAQPQSAGHGINLQYGGSMAVWFGLNWSLEYDLQFNARLHRQGQSCAVRIVRIVSDRTIDERVINVLNKKDRSQSAILEALKGEIS